MAVEQKIADGFKAFNDGVSGAKGSGVNDKILAIMAQIAKLEAESRQKAKTFDTAEDKLSMRADKLDPAVLDKTWKEAEAAYADFNVYLKRFRGILKAGVAKGEQLRLDGPAKQNFLRPMDILSKEMDAASNSMKLDLKAIEVKVARARGQADTAAKEHQRVLEDFHLRIRKACDDAEANVKKFLNKPTEDTLMAAFSNGAAFRTLGTTQQMMKKMGEKYGKEEWYGKLLKMYAAAGPDGIREVALQKNSDYWKAKYGKFTRGSGEFWNTTQIQAEARRLITKELPKWRKLAADMKVLYKP